MNEEKKSNVPAYIQNSMQSIEGMLEYAKLILGSKLAPAHFYEKDEKGKPIYTEGKPEAVLIVLQHGMELGLSVSQSLQQVVPVNGLLSIKGDGAKSLIFRSGVLKDGTWKEEITGSIENEDYTVKITSTRSDNGKTLTSTFSVNDAKRAGLWIDQAKVKGQDGWKYKLSSWYKYPARMCYYRALGFHARDNYPDVISGLYTLEEAQDMPQDPETVIETPKGEKIIIPDKEHVQERSEHLTSKASEAISKKNAVKEVPVKEESSEHVYKREELEDMGDGIFDFVHENFNPVYGFAWGGRGRKSRKKFIDAVLTYQSEGLSGLTQSSTKEEIVAESEEKGHTEAHVEEKPEDQKEFEQQIGAEDKEEDHSKDAEPTDAVSYRGITISPLPESGSRAFPDKRVIFQGLHGLGLTEDTFKKVAGELVIEETGETFLSKWDSIESFSKGASIDQIRELTDVFKAVK